MKLYNNFYECMEDLGKILGISSLKDLNVAIKFARETNFPAVADYFEELQDKLYQHIREEFADVGNANSKTIS